MNRFKKILKIVSVVFLILLIGLFWAFANFTSPKNNKKVLLTFKESAVKPIISKEKFRDFEYRKLTFGKDSLKPTLVFVHGTIGSCLDFSEYIKDSVLQAKANFVSYDRVGYNFEDKNNVQESITFENELLQDVIKDLNPEKTILVGYSYGGPIALATKQKVKKVILCAPAVYSKVEPMPSIINVYKWKATRWLVPSIWQQASKEKLTHKQDLHSFEKNWKSTPNQVVSIHGDNDWIVPYSNSEYLQTQIPPEQFELITIPNVGHDLIWSNFELIKAQLLKSLD